MICPRCGVTAANHRKFCGDCGSPLPWQCSVCGSENPADKRFCVTVAPPRGRTRRAASRPPSPHLAERRQLTVMFVDLVASTALGARLDPEDLRDVIAAFHGTVTGLVARFDGFVARYMGDGVLVYFGYPQAHEDDAERAIRAGLTIVDAVSKLATIAGPAGTLSARVGIASGPVVVGDLIGSGSSREFAVVGDTPNLAARLQAAAEPGAIVISNAIRSLTGGLFEYRELMLPDLKGRGGAATCMDGAWRKRHRQPIRGAAPGPVAPRWPHGRTRIAATPLGAGQGRRRTRRVASRRAGHGKIPLDRGAGTRGQRHAAFAPSISLLTPSPGYAPASRHPADRTRGQLPARRLAGGEMGQARDNAVVQRFFGRRRPSGRPPLDPTHYCGPAGGHDTAAPEGDDL